MPVAQLAARFRRCLSTWWMHALQIALVAFVVQPTPTRMTVRATKVARGMMMTTMITTRMAT